MSFKDTWPVLFALRRVVLLRSCIRLTPSGIAFGSLLANKISRFAHLTLARCAKHITFVFKQKYHSAQNAEYHLSPYKTKNKNCAYFSAQFFAVNKSHSLFILDHYPSKPLGLPDCHLQMSAHICSMLRSAVQPSSFSARELSA